MESMRFRSMSFLGSGKKHSEGSPDLIGGMALRASAVFGKVRCTLCGCSWALGFIWALQDKWEGISGKHVVLNPAVWISCRQRPPTVLSDVRGPQQQCSYV